MWIKTLFRQSFEEAINYPDFLERALAYFGANIPINMIVGGLQRAFWEIYYRSMPLVEKELFPPQPHIREIVGKPDLPRKQQFVIKNIEMGWDEAHELHDKIIQERARKVLEFYSFVLGLNPQKTTLQAKAARLRGFCIVEERKTPEGPTESIVFGHENNPREILWDVRWSYPSDTYGWSIPITRDYEQTFLDYGYSPPRNPLERLEIFGSVQRSLRGGFSGYYLEEGLWFDESSRFFPLNFEGEVLEQLKKIKFFQRVWETPILGTS